MTKKLLFVGLAMVMTLNTSCVGTLLVWLFSGSFLFA
jgi:hypothetical protein